MRPLSADEIAARARDIRLLTCDVDGVLTDGRIYLADDGREMKAFCALDGVGIHLLQAAGVTVAWITGSNAPVVALRARSLGVEVVVQGAEDKLAPWERLRGELDLAPSKCAHIGDDLPDLPVLERCGLALTVPHAPVLLLERAHYVTRREGGTGAVREACELIVAAKGATRPRRVDLDL